ncbi:MAG: hypothetical protein NWE98_08835 [Candidatus Bathyarchaeota archaeon]|nr:hypothetical protein [Candidatus Bathyarchaeota archaeon]
MKNKIFTIILIGLLVFSCLELALAAQVKCPTCKGTGEVKCPTCKGTGRVGDTQEVACDACGGTGILKPRVSVITFTVSQSEGVSYVTGTVKNRETVDVEGAVTASVGGHSNSTSTMTFPAESETSVTVSIDYVGTYQTTQQLMMNTKMSVTGVEEITCPYCDGTGTIAQGGEICTKCDGTGYVVCQTCGGTGYVDSALVTQSSDIPWGTIGAAVAVVVVIVGGIGIFMVIKKRRVNEKTLRRYSTREFNDWVLSRLEGKAAASRDTALGIDGYSASGYPVAIKQADGIGMNVIDAFASSLARNKTRNGVIVAFSFGSDAVRGKVRAKTNYGLNIEMLTVEDLIFSKRPI